MMTGRSDTGRAVLSIIGIGLFLVSSLAVAAAQDFYLHDGDRVTFYGDSITAQRLYTQDINSL